MRFKGKSTDRWSDNRPAETWQDSSTRWLMENYDIWSATPVRDSDQPARPLPCK